MDKIKVLVVDDSQSAREMIKAILRINPDIEVIGEAVDGLDALDKIDALDPDVVTLDIILPHLSGIGVLDRVMSKRPVRFLLLSAVTEKNTSITINGLNKGAIDFITKPSTDDFTDISQQLLSKILAIAKIPLSNIQVRCKKLLNATASKKFTEIRNQGFLAVAIGLSTGGPKALTQILSALPAPYHLPIFIVQHMPKFFLSEFAKDLDKRCAIHVKEGQHGEEVLPGVAYISPGERHMIIRNGRVEISNQPPINGHKPSIDILFTSLSEEYKEKVCGLILTGLGNDGMQGADAIKMNKGMVIAQDKKSSVVFSMPKAIISAGLADRIINLNHMPTFLNSLSNGKG